MRICLSFNQGEKTEVCLYFSSFFLSALVCPVAGVEVLTVYFTLYFCLFTIKQLLVRLALNNLPTKSEDVARLLIYNSTCVRQ